MHSPSRFAATALLAAAVVLAQSPTNVEGRVEALLARMTLVEKIGQMSQSTAMATPISEGIKTEIRAGRWGSFLNAGSPADRAEAQRIATTESRLHIPLLFGRDVIHGYKTIFPIPLAQAATWDPELVEQASRQAAREAAAEGIRWTFAPMIDIARDPRWGRVAESLGEDPRLGSTLAAAMVHGFQGAALADAASMAACAKHFVGYGAAEAGRDYNSAWIPEILLREVYLPPFHAARDAGVATFMTAFNTLNGVPATGNRFLLRDILRTEWKYDGVVVSDYEAITEMIRHGYARDAREAARKAARRGRRHGDGEHRLLRQLEVAGGRRRGEHRRNRRRRTKHTAPEIPLGTFRPAHPNARDHRSHSVITGTRATCGHRERRPAEE